jgi:hypothetical protein
MTSNASETTQKSISEQLSEIWKQLSRNQRRFVVAAQEFATKKEAAESIGLEPDTVYRWPKVVDDAIDLFSQDIESAALGIILNNAGKAAMIKAAGLDSDDEKIRQLSATEILDRVLGRPTQKQEISGKDGEAIEHKLVILPAKDK